MELTRWLDALPAGRDPARREAGGGGGDRRRARAPGHRHHRGAAEFAAADGEHRALAREFGERLLIGAGTVMTPAQVAEIAAAGGRLIVTPHADAAIVRAAKRWAARGARLLHADRGVRDAGGRRRRAEAVSGRGGQPRRAARVAGGAAGGHRGAAGRRHRCVEHGGLAGGRAAGFGIGSAIYRPGDSPETVAAKAHALMLAA